MLVPIAFLLGFALGWGRASRKGGDRLDRLQYGGAHGIAFVLVAVALSVLAQRLGLL